MQVKTILVEKEDETKNPNFKIIFIKTKEMKKIITYFIITIFIAYTTVSCEEKEIARDEIVTKNLNTEILKGTEGTLKITAKGNDYDFHVDYSYVNSVGANREGWSLWIITANLGGIEAITQSINNGIAKIEKGVVINESTFTEPASGGYFFSAEREFGQPNFTYNNGFNTEFYKFYYIPIKFPTRDRNVQAGPPFYGYIEVYVNPEKIIFGKVAYNTDGKISAGD
jgi:hypothetical protein